MLPLPAWLSWLECCPLHQRVGGSIPGRGRCLGCGFNLWTKHILEATDQCFFLTLMLLSLSFSLSPPSSLSLKSINIKQVKQQQQQQKSFHPDPIRASHSLRLPTLTSQVHTIALINILCFAQSFCHAL